MNSVAPRATGRWHPNSPAGWALHFKEDTVLMTFSSLVWNTCLFPTGVFHYSLQKKKKKVLVRLQLPLFGQERESNILSVEGGKGGSKNAAASRMRENIKKDGLTRRDPPQMEMWASDGPPCRRDVGRSTRLLRSVFTCGSPGCWGGLGTSALIPCLMSHLAETDRQS